MNSRCNDEPYKRIVLLNVLHIQQLYAIQPVSAGAAKTRSRAFTKGSDMSSHEHASGDNCAQPQ